MTNSYANCKFLKFAAEHLYLRSISELSELDDDVTNKGWRGLASRLQIKDESVLKRINEKDPLKAVAVLEEYRRMNKKYLQVDELLFHLDAIGRKDTSTIIYNICKHCWDDDSSPAKIYAHELGMKSLDLIASYVGYEPQNIKNLCYEFGTNDLDINRFLHTTGAEGAIKQWRYGRDATMHNFAKAILVVCGEEVVNKITAFTFWKEDAKQELIREGRIKPFRQDFSNNNEKSIPQQIMAQPQAQAQAQPQQQELLILYEKEDSRRSECPICLDAAPNVIVLTCSKCFKIY